MSFIASEMCSEIVTYVFKNNLDFSIMVDESTSVANVQSLVVYLRTNYDDVACVYFLGLLSVDNATAVGLEKF